MEVRTERWKTPPLGPGGEADVLEGTRYFITLEQRSFLFSIVDGTPNDAMFEGEVDGEEIRKFWTVSHPLPAESSPVGELAPLPRDDSVLAKVLEYLQDEIGVERLNLYSARESRIILEHVSIADAIGVIGSAKEDVILPRLALDEFLEGSDDIDRRPWVVPGHCIYLVRYDGATQTFLTLEEVGESWDELYDESLENLTRFMQERSTANGDGPPGEATTMEIGGHGAVSSLPLLPIFADLLVQYISDAEFFAIPEKDTFLAFNQSAIDRVAAAVQSGFRSARHPVSPHVYAVRDGEIVIERLQSVEPE